MGLTTRICHVCGKNFIGASKATTCNNCLTTGFKWCSSCDEVKPISEYYKKVMAHVAVVSLVNVGVQYKVRKIEGTMIGQMCALNYTKVDALDIH